MASARQSHCAWVVNAVEPEGQSFVSSRDILPNGGREDERSEHRVRPPELANRRARCTGQGAEVCRGQCDDDMYPFQPSSERRRMRIVFFLLLLLSSDTYCSHTPGHCSA
eukprot:6385035-Prymnesium_polylepis.1